MYSDFCVFNDTATTEIYTYVHTLSLHVALPIWTRPMPNISAKNITARMSLSATAAITFDGTILTIAAIPDGASRRSEEHTSELQSLMRISYAIFCLKKKTPCQDNRNYLTEH